jgi:hypothetical protein
MRHVCLTWRRRTERAGHYLGLANEINLLAKISKYDLAVVIKQCKAFY